MRFLISVVLLAPFVRPASPATIHALTNACFFGCLDGSQTGDPAVSSTSRGESFVDPASGQGYSLSSQASVTAWRNAFSIYFQANGSANGFNDVIPISAGGGVQYSDTLVINGGTGQGTAVFPWRVDGIATVEGVPGAAGATFVMGCQLIPVGSITGGVGCATGGADIFSSSTTYDEVWNLTVPFTFGVSYVLNMNAGGSAGVGVINGSASVIADFSRTGTLGAARVFDSFGNPVPGATITAESGLDYFNPQVSAEVPEPGSYSLLLCGIVALYVGRRQTASQQRTEPLKQVHRDNYGL